MVGALFVGQPGDMLTRRQALAGAAVAGAAAAVPALRPARARATAQDLPDVAGVLAAGASLADLGVAECAALLQAREVSARELLAACTERIEARNGPVTFAGSPTTVNAFVRRYDDLAEELAAAADRRLDAAAAGGDAAPVLCGVPVGLKDLYAVDGLPLTASSRILEGHVATGDSAVWAKLKAAGMVLVGHTHTCEFAMYYDTPQTGNPWALDRSAGGSSGGSAAALAARMLPAATGSDTLGSLRIPAAWCGVSSIKPTFGLISAAGVIPYAWSLDHCGPLARSVADVALLLGAMTGADPADPSTDVAAVAPAAYPSTPRPGDRPLDGTRVGLPAEPGTLDPGVAERFAATQEELTALGATLVPLDYPEDPFSVVDQLVLLQDALAFHAPWFPSRAAEYGSVDQQFLTLFRSVNATAQQYIDVHRRRAALRDAWRLMQDGERLDAFLLPVSRIEVPDRLVPKVVATDPVPAQLQTYLADYLGFPVVTLPAGTSRTTGLPVGVQLIGAPFDEATLLQIGVDLQHRSPHHEQQPDGLA